MNIDFDKPKDNWSYIADLYLLYFEGTEDASEESLDHLILLLVAILISL